MLRGLFILTLVRDIEAFLVEEEVRFHALWSQASWSTQEKATLNCVVGTFLREYFIVISITKNSLIIVRLLLREFGKCR